MKNILTKNYKVKEPIELSKRPTSVDLGLSKKEIKKELKKCRKGLSEHQDIMYAHNRYSVLICFQGMDTAGKDSLIREVFKEFNPRGVVVHSFKTPSSNELEHDYLWRHYRALPERGKYGVFNRTHYENVLVTRVHPEYILNENLPGIENLADITPEFWDRRFSEINNFEEHISGNGVLIFKFFLHLSGEEQRKRLLRRLEKEKHNWKFSPGDLEERERWNDYQKYYEEAINHSSQQYAPWFTIPADDKKTARLLVAKIIFEELSKYKDIKEPELDEKIQENIEFYKRELRKD